MFNLNFRSSSPHNSYRVCSCSFRISKQCLQHSKLFNWITRLYSLLNHRYMIYHNIQTCHSIRFNRNHSDFLLKFGSFLIFRIFRKHFIFFFTRSADNLCKRINLDDIVTLNTDIVFYYIIKCGVEIGTNILVVTIPKIDSAELFILSLIRL